MADFVPPQRYRDETDAEYQKRLKEARNAFSQAQAEARSAYAAFQRTIPRGSTLIYDTAEKGSPEGGTPMPMRVVREPAKGGRGVARSTSILQREDKAALRAAADRWSGDNNTPRTVEELSTLYKVGSSFIDLPAGVIRRGPGAVERHLLMEIGAPAGVSMDEFRRQVRVAAEQGTELERYVAKTGGDRPLPGMRRGGGESVLATRIVRVQREGGQSEVVPRGYEVRGERLEIPARQKDSPIKREPSVIINRETLTESQITNYYTERGDSVENAGRKAKEFIAYYRAQRERPLTREDLDLIAAVKKAPTGLIVRHGAGGRARKGSEVQREFQKRQRDLMRRMRAAEGQRASGPSVLTRSGKSVFTTESQSFDPGRASAEEWITGESLRQPEIPRAMVKGQQQFVREERRAAQAAKKAAKQAEQAAREAAFIRAAKGDVDGLGALDSASMIGGAVMLGAVALGVWMAYRAVIAPAKKAA